MGLSTHFAGDVCHLLQRHVDPLLVRGRPERHEGSNPVMLDAAICPQLFQCFESKFNAVVELCLANNGSE